MKTNILLDNNIIEKKFFFINMTKRETSIFNINVIISLKIKILTRVIQRSIHIKKIIVVFSHSKMIISINHIDLFVTRNFFFKLNDHFNLSIYVHLIDSSITSIIIRNDKNLLIMILKNMRLKRTIEIDFFNVFYIENKNNVKHLIVKKSKFAHTNE